MYTVQAMSKGRNDLEFARIMKICRIPTIVLMAAFDIAGLAVHFIRYFYGVNFDVE